MLRPFFLPLFTEVPGRCSRKSIIKVDLILTCIFLPEELLLRSASVRARGGAKSASIYRSPEGQAEILRLYDEAISRLGISCESMMVSTRYGETHLLSLGPENAPPVMFFHGGNFLNPTCLRWYLPIAQRHRIYAPDIVG